MMEIDPQKAPESGSPDSSRPESPAIDETPSPTAEIIETVSIITADRVTEEIHNAEEKSKDESPAPEIISPRAYQREMLEQSLKRNVIVAMDTGSGKTQVAVLRIQAELERCSPDKIVWFLGKTVSLCEQQFNVIYRQMPSVPMRLLTGQLNIDAWSPDVWPRILEGTRIVVSTFDILRDALDHAFVRMDKLALIVFDEVHNCVKNSSGRKIMINFYHEHKSAGLPVPGILGLTASPIISSNVAEIEILENTMDAVCVTPTVHRELLLKHVNRPHLVRSLYDVKKFPARTALMKELHSEYLGMDITKDPQIVKLRALAVKDEKKRLELSDVVMKHNTFSQNQMKGLWNKSKDILGELGNWAADRYISQLIRLFLERYDSPNVFADAWSNEDRTYLAGHLRRINISSIDNAPPTTEDLTHKVERLIHELLAAGNAVVGIVFVKERATANVLCELLNSYPAISELYRVGVMVGTSNFGSRKQNAYEYLNGGTQVLDDFRSGAINLLVATSVLEEGIDVPACNLVVCFDETTTLKSFIQRRGRARMQESKMIALEASTSDPRAWEDLEQGMKRRYEDDQRELARLDELARSEPTDSIYYIVKNTGARLDLENSRQHLEHFCAVVFRTAYVSHRPDYVFHKNESGFGGPTLRATVTLPAGLPPHLRKFQSACEWKSEKNAMKDAAFHAYVALYEEGLISDHLLPISAVSDKTEDIMDLTPEPLFNPWIQVAQKWNTDCDKWLYTFEFTDDEFPTPIRVYIAMPAELSQPRDITIYPENGPAWSIKCIEGKRISHEDSLSLPDHTSALLAMNFGHRWSVEDRDHVIKVIYEDKDVSRDDIGAIPLSGSEEEASSRRILVRDRLKAPFHYIRTISSKPLRQEVQHPFYEYDGAPDEQYLVLEQWTRRSDLLHALKGNEGKKNCSKPYGWVLPISWASVDKVPRRVVKFGMLIPSILHELEIQLIASELCSTLLEPVKIANLQLALEAISSRSAIEPVDYERLELLGDSILKFCTVVQAYSEHPFWPEGLLNHFKDRLVSNTRLHRVCIQKGLSKFILSKGFTGQKWRPMYLDNFLDEESVDRPARFIGPKNLADVVEALIGASFQDGGMTKALKCISVFLGDICNWHEEGLGRDILFGKTPSDVELPPTMEPLEELIGYSFQKKSLLIEAVTHGSYATNAQERSYEQLEFLGDAVLDYIIVTRMFQFNPPIPNGKLHMIKTAMVNGEFLAFVNMEHGLRRMDTEIKPGGNLELTETSLPLWKFMRYSSSDMSKVIQETEVKYEELRGEIATAIKEGTHYPWALLARLHPKKFYSDLFEALIGAVWIDSGSMETCASVLHKFGILPYLDRILNDNVHVQHPKEELTRLAVDQKMTYDYTVIEGPDPECLCTVRVGERLVGEIEGALNKVEAMVKAAEQAVRLLTVEKKAADQGVDLMDMS